MMLDRSVRKDVALIVIVLATGLGTSSFAVLELTSQSIQIQKNDIIKYKEDTASTLAGRFELRIQDAIKVLQISGKSDVFYHLDSIDKVSDDFKGIPESEEQAKRKIAQDILSEFKNFETVALVLPNADVYFVEPYQNQLILPRLNFADREWYQGVINTGQPYAADPILSAATGNMIVPIAVPLYEDDGTLKAILTAGLNLDSFQVLLLEQLNLENGNRAIYVDDQNRVIVDIDWTDRSENPNFLSGNTAPKYWTSNEFVDGRAGNLIETIDGQEVLEVYRPIHIGTEAWGVILIQPTSIVFAAVNNMWYQMDLMLATIAAISTAMGFLLVRFRMRSALVKQLAIANAELKERDKMKEEFIKIASHELKTPIQPIIGYATLGERGMIKDKDAWKVVHKEAQRLMKLANNIVDISTSQSGLMMYNMEKTSVVELLRSAVESAKSIIEEKHLALELRVDEQCEAIAIDADPVRLKFVFSELLDNAVKFTETGGITVECRIVGDRISIAVSDTGTAIPDEILPRIFGLFSSASGTDAKTQGAGLGLVICKEIVTAHAGILTARNRDPGPGAVFEITLPVYGRKELSPNTSAASA